MAVAIDTAGLALGFIPHAQRQLDLGTGGGRRFQIHRVSVYATILFLDSEIWRQSRSAVLRLRKPDFFLSKEEALEWQADPDDDVGDAEVLHHLHQQAAKVPLLSIAISQSDQGNATTTLTGSALSASIQARRQGRVLSSFHRHCYRESGLELLNSRSNIIGISRNSGIMTALFPSDGQLRNPTLLNVWGGKLSRFIVWADRPRNEQPMFWQLQVDFVDLFSRRTLPTYRPGRRRRTTFNQFLEVSDSPVVENTPRGNRLQKYNGVRHRPDRRTWVAEMKPPKHKTKQDFGNFKSAAEAAHAVDAAFYHYARPELLNFPDTSLQFLSTRPPAAPGLDEKAKVKFVKEEAKLLLRAIAATSRLQSTPTNSLQILELPASPRRCPAGQFRSFSEISWPFSCRGPEEGDDAISQPQQWVYLDSTGVQTNLKTLSSVQISGQGWDWTEESMLSALPTVVNPSACEIRSMWLDSLIQSSPAPTYSRSPSPSHFQEEIAYALLEQQSV